jgi:ankyrin repeat protein
MKKMYIPLAIIVFVALSLALFFLIPERQKFYTILIPASIVYFVLVFYFFSYFGLRGRQRRYHWGDVESGDNEREEKGDERKVNRTLRKFFDAAKDGDLRTVEELLGKGVDIESHDEGRGYTALIHAAEGGQIEMVRFLLEKGADVDGKGTESGRTALMLAAWEGHTEVVRFLISKGAKVNMQRSDKVHALYVAAQNNHPETVKLLLESGAEIDLGGLKDNATPLMIACQQGHAKMVDLLVRRGANVNARTALDGYGYTPLVLAAEFGFLEIIKILIDAGAEINARNGELGHTALMVSAQNLHLEVVKYLLEKKADATIHTKDGASTVSYCPMVSKEEEKAKEIRKLLTEASARKRKFRIS